MTLLPWLLGGYCAGSIPTSYLLGKWLKGLDIREHGSGNAGATNVFRVLGPVPAVITLLIDAAKGYFPAALCLHATGVPLAGAVVGLSAMAGHVWPVFLRFRGGKGVATAAGVFLALLPVPTLFAAGVFALVLALTRYVSLGSLLGAIALIGGALLRREPPPLSAVAVLAGILIFYKHRSNIARLMRGEEQAIGRRN